MYKKFFGTKKQIRFDNENEYYEALGYLAKSSDGTTGLVWEHNEEQGAWGSEGRIHFYIAIEETPLFGNFDETAGRGNSIICRVNCNEFVKNINENHNFQMGRNQDIIAIRGTIPEEFLADFDRGLNL